jgi:hypothetical protein
MHFFGKVHQYPANSALPFFGPLHYFMDAGYAGLMKFRAQAGQTRMQSV